MRYFFIILCIFLYTNLSATALEKLKIDIEHDYIESKNALLQDLPIENIAYIQGRLDTLADILDSIDWYIQNQGLEDGE